MPGGRWRGALGSRCGKISQGCLKAAQHLPEGHIGAWLGSVSLRQDQKWVRVFFAMKGNAGAGGYE